MQQAPVCVHMRDFRPVQWLWRYCTLYGGLVWTSYSTGKQVSAREEQKVHTLVGQRWQTPAGQPGQPWLQPDRQLGSAPPPALPQLPPVASLSQSWPPAACTRCSQHASATVSPALATSPQGLHSSRHPGVTANGATASSCDTRSFSGREKSAADTGSTCVSAAAPAGQHLKLLRVLLQCPSLLLCICSRCPFCQQFCLQSLLRRCSCSLRLL